MPGDHFKLYAVSPSELLAIARQRLEANDLTAADNFACMVLERHPTHGPAWLLRAELALRQRQVMETAALLLRAEAGEGSEDVEFQLVSGNLWRTLGKLEQTEAAYRRAVTMAPEHARAWYLLATTLHERGLSAAAAPAYRKALSLDDGLAHAHNNYAVLCQLSGDKASALDHYRRAIAADPGYIAAWQNYASLLQVLGRYAEALTGFERVLQHQPDHADALAGSLYMRRHLLDWEGIVQRQQRLEAVLQQGQARIAPFIHMGLVDDPAAQRQVAERWADAFEPQLPPLEVPAETGPRRLRLGYLGGDFFAHATSWLTRSLFRRHDRSQFEVVAYDYGPQDGSEVRATIMAGVDRFETVGHLDDLALARHIRAAGIDILIDLKGWSRESRSNLLAQRLAPVQAHYLTYPGTLGASWCDYLFADHWVVPQGEEKHYREAIVRMPGSYQINDRDRSMAAAPKRAELGLPEQAMVFCCFNQHYKLGPTLFTCWLAVLRAVPDSVLWLLAGAPVAEDRLRKLAQAQGVDPGRLLFAPPLPQAEHLARLGLADLALDTLPYNSHTTTSDALWAGVPLVTCVGRSYASRVAASCLSAAGLPELITQDLEAYQALIIALSRDRARLAALRQRLAAQRLSCSLFDTDASVRQLEQAYLAMWDRYRQGLAPAGMDL